MKVTVHILPNEGSESMEPSLRSSPRFPAPRSARTSTQRSGKPPEEELDDQFLKAKELNRELEFTKVEIERKQQSLMGEQAKLMSKSVDLSANNVVEQVRLILREKQPNLEKLMDITLIQEREKHERQNERVLQILKAKDVQIAELQQRVMIAEESSQAIIREKDKMQNEIRDLHVQYQSTAKSELQLKQCVAEHEETIKLLSENHEQLKETLKSGASPQEYEREICSLRQQLESLSDQRDATERLRKELVDSQRQLEELTKREVYVLEFANRQEDFKKTHLDELNKKTEEVNVAIRALEETKSAMQKLEEQVNNEKIKSSKLETDMNKILEQNRELETQVEQFQGIYKSDNEKLANIVEKTPSRADRSLTMEDLRSSSKDYISRLKDRMEGLQKKVNELEANKETLEMRSKIAENTVSAHQVDKANLMKKYTEEISRLQNALMQLESKSNKITKAAEVQTPLKGSNISDLSHIIEDYKEKLEYANSQREEREKYISQLESDLHKEQQEVANAKADLEAVIKKYEENTGTMQKLEENEIITKLNSRVSALQIQIHQLQTKLKESEEELNKTRQVEKVSLEASSRPSTIAEHVTERMEGLEMTIVQLREEVIQLEIEKRNIEQSARMEQDMRDAKIKALEGMLAPSEPNVYPSIAAKVELEKLKEISKAAELNAKKTKEDFIAVQKELIRLKQIERLANILPTDGEITLKLTNKIKSQKTDIKTLQALLKRAKIEFDKMTVALQSRGEKPITVMPEQKRESSEFDWEKLMNNRYEQRMKELSKQVQDYKVKLNDSLRVALQMKEEFTHKIVEHEGHTQKQLFKLAEETRLKSREVQMLEQRIEKSSEKLKNDQLHIEELEESKAKVESELTNKIKQLELALNEEKHINDQTCLQIKKHEIVVQERSAQIAVLMETIELLQTTAKDGIAQKFMNCNTELCSMRATNAKAEVKVAELEFTVSTQKQAIDKYSENEKKLIEEKLFLGKQLKKLKASIEFQAKEIERLEKEVDESSIDAVNESVKSHTLTEQLSTKEKRIEVLKAQLNELQNRVANTAKPLEKEWREEVKGVQSKEIVVLVKQVLANLEGDCRDRYNTTIEKLCNIILKSDKIILDLEQTNAEKEQRAIETRIKTEEKALFDMLHEKCSAFGRENTELMILLETMLTSQEKLLLEDALKVGRGVRELKHSLQQANQKLIELAMDNLELKQMAEEAHDKLEAKTKEMQLAKVNLEKELAMAKIKAEEEVSVKLSARNEEIKTYFDTNVAKLILNKGEELSLTKEICAQKLMIDKLQTTIGNSSKEKEVLASQAKELMKALTKQTAELTELHEANCSKYKKQLNTFKALINEKGDETTGVEYELSKKALRVCLNRKNAEIMDLISAMMRLKEENSKLKIHIEKKDKLDEFKSLHGKLAEELENKFITLTSEVTAKDEIMKSMDIKLSTMKAEHEFEIKNIQSDIKLQIQTERKRIMEEYANLEKKYKPGEAPGEIMAENYGLQHNCTELKQAIENLQSEIVILRQKLATVNEDALQSRDEAELYKRSLMDVEEFLGVNCSRLALNTSTPSARSRILTSADRRQKEPRKRLPSIGGIEKSVKLEDEEIPKIPKLIKAILDAKSNEAQAEVNIRKLAREELENRKELSSMQAQLKDYESKLRHYERLLKDNNVNAIIRMDSEEETASWMKKRILELEATCEDLRTKELSNLVNYEAPEAKTSTENLSENTTNLLINGVVALCNRLAVIEVQGKEKHMNSIERLQRLAIKTLTAFIRKLQGDSAWNLQCAVPSKEEDRLVWYLELAELQAQHVEDVVLKLKEYTSKIAIEITGSFSSAAQVKAAAMELANQTKEVADEAANFKSVCNLVRKDMESATGIVTINTKDKENCRKTGEKDKVLVIKENKSVKTGLSNKEEANKALELLRQEAEKLAKQKQSLEAEVDVLKNKNDTLEKDFISTKSNNEKLQGECEEFSKKLANVNALLEQANKSLNESADKISANHKLLEEEKEKLRLFNIENKELKAKSLVLNKKLEIAENETVRILRSANEELDEKLQSEIAMRKSEIELWLKEREQMRVLIDALRAEKEKKKLRIKKKQVNDVASDCESREKGKPHREKVKKLKAEIELKSKEVFELSTKLQDATSRLRLSELNLEDEKRKVMAITEKIKLIQLQPSAVNEVVSDLAYKKEMEDIKLRVDEIKAANNRLENEVVERTKQEEEYKQERDKMVAVIQELDHELKLKTTVFVEEESKLKQELTNKSSIIEMKEGELQSLNSRYYELESSLKEAAIELEAEKSNIEQLKETLARTEAAYKEQQEIAVPREELLGKLQARLATIEEEYKKSIMELREEYKTSRATSEELVALYELQLKMLKDKFKEEYEDLNNKITAQLQAKGVKDSKRKEEDSIDFITQLIQKDAQIKNLEKECSKAATKLGTTKIKLKKLQTQLKEDTKKKLKVSDLTRSKSDKSSLENVGLEDQMKAYNGVLKEKTELEFKLGKTQSLIKGLECKLNTEKDTSKSLVEKLDETKKELESLRESLKVCKKEQAELIRKHKVELQKVLDELNHIKADWKSPEELSKCMEEKQELEAQLKILREELNRKKDLMKQWKEKDELRQSENGQLINEVESIKDDSEKLKRTVKELTRKDQTIRSLKSAVESAKVNEKQLSEENKVLIEKVKVLKAEAARKDAILKTFKERSEEMRSDKDCVKEKESEIEKLKTKIASSKQDIDRKDDQIRVLKGKLEALTQECSKQKSELEVKSREDTKGTEREKVMEGKNQQLSVMVRTIFRELLTAVEKLRMRTSAYVPPAAGPEVETQFYKESLDILGIGAEDMKEFVSKEENKSTNNEDLVELIEKINRLVEDKEIDKDYEDIIEGYKVLAKEKSDLEKKLTGIEETA